MVAAVARFEKGGKVFEITSADGRYATELRKHLREGWTRVPDPRCEVPLGAEPINPTLEEVLRGEPNDPSGALVYADWLEQQGHPRGALISVQHRLQQDPSDKQLAEVERMIFDNAGDSLLSKPLRAHLSIHRGSIQTEVTRNPFVSGFVEFDHGFIRHASLALKRRGGDEDLLWELLRHPSARAMVSLSIIVDKSRDIPLVATLLTHAPRLPLRGLQFRVDDRGPLVDLAGLDTAFPTLEDLELKIHNVRLGSLALPRLKRLAVIGEHADIGLQLAARTWPELDTLSVTGDLDKLRMAFERPNFPKLQSLSLQLPPSVVGQDRAAAVVSAVHMVLRSPNVGQLTSLQVPPLPPEAVELLVANRAKLSASALQKLREERQEVRAHLPHVLDVAAERDREPQ